MLENLIKFLSENGIEIPEGADSSAIMTILQSLLDAENGTSEPAVEEEKKEQAPVAKPSLGVA